jgi:hypothetical protein
MKQWLLIIHSPNKYEIGRFDINYKPVNYILSGL